LQVDAHVFDVAVEIAEARGAAVFLRADLDDRPARLWQVTLEEQPLVDVAHAPKRKRGRSRSVPVLKPYSLAVSSGIARGKINAVELPDQLRAAELVVVIGHRNDLVAAAREVLQHRRRETRLD